MIEREETVTYLEMNDQRQLVAARVPAVKVSLCRAELPCPELSRFFYTAVGGQWFWIDRLPWTYAQWMTYITAAGHETWIASMEGTPAGYFELHGPPQGDVEIASFGLLPQFTGRGLGGYLLALAVERAWQRKPPRVWLHTSSFDHPQALPNYLKRGFRAVRTETFRKQLPDEPLGPWPGAQVVKRSPS
jgi:GNAT superfamily N-acetyltransferase